MSSGDELKGEFKMKKVTILGLLVMLLAGSGLPATVNAITYSPVPVYSITCTGITQSNPDAQAVWDRDTSGTGLETLLYEVTDGDGTTLFHYPDIRGVGAVAWTVSFGYYEAPDSNPIHLLITSPAGNGFPEQVLVDITGDCEDLPTASAPPGDPNPPGNSNPGSPPNPSKRPVDSPGRSGDAGRPSSPGRSGSKP